MENGLPRFFALFVFSYLHFLCFSFGFAEDRSCVFLAHQVPRQSQGTLRHCPHVGTLRSTDSHCDMPATPFSLFFRHGAWRDNDRPSIHQIMK